MPRLSVADCEVVMQVLDEKIQQVLLTRQPGSGKYINVRARLKQRLETAKKAKESDE